MHGAMSGFLPPIDLRRRKLLGAAASCLAWAGSAQAQQRRPQTDPLLVGVEAALMASGLAPRLREAVARDTGIAIQLTAAASGDLLPRLERGDLDVAITQAPDAELSLDRQGLIHDRQLIAIGEYVLAGPAAWARPPKPVKPVKGKPPEPPAPGDPAGIRGLNDAAAALIRIAEAGARGECSFIATGEASGTRYAEAALWKAAGPKPFGPWLRTAGPGPRAALDLARETGAYVLVERGLLAAAGTGMAALVSGDARMAAEYRAMRSFRVNHPAGKLFIGWLAGPNGRAVVGRYGNYRVAPKA